MPPAGPDAKEVAHLHVAYLHQGPSVYAPFDASECLWTAQPTLHIWGVPFGEAHVMVKLPIKRVGPIVVPLPVYQTSGSVGLDLRAAIPAEVVLLPGQRMLVPTGLVVAVPKGYEGTVRARSGTALTHGISMSNGIGTIDPDYRGELGILLINLGQDPFTIAPLQRVAQFVISPVLQVEPTFVDVMDDTDRGQGGYGSTKA